MKKTIVLALALTVAGVYESNAQTKPAAKTTPAKTPAATKTTTAAAPATGTFKDERDGEEYKTAVINGQTWMIEPLRYKPESCDCIYVDENNENKKKGAFYGLEQAKNSIPEGWRLPTDEEYQAVLDKYGKTADDIKKAGFIFDLINFDYTTYKNLKDYKGNDFMIQTLVGDKKAFPTGEQAFFFCIKKVPGDDTLTIDFKLIAHKTESQTYGTSGDYARVFLVKK